MGNIDDSGLEKSEDDDIALKRQKLTPGGEVTLTGDTGQLGRSASVIPEDGEDNGPERTADISTPKSSVSETAPTEIQLYPQVMDANQEWEMREITGEEDVNGVPHYLVEWCPTLVPKDSMGNGQELVAEFEARQARIRARLGVKKARKGRLDLKRGKHASSGKQQRRPRGRPRKQK